MYHPTKKRLSQQHGLSLVETMIAMALSLVILAGVFQIYSGNKRTYTMQDELARLQENARFALELMSRDIRSTGYNGCLRTDLSPINFVTRTHSTFDPASGIQGWEAAGTAPSATAVDVDPIGEATANTTGTDSNWSIGVASGLGSLNALPDSDIIRVWYASNAAEDLTAVAADSSTVTLAGNGISIAAGDVMVLSDCGRIDYVMACSAPVSDVVNIDTCTGLRGNDLTNKFLSVDASSTLVRKLQSAIYYVSKQGGDTTNPPALYKKILSSDTLAGNALMVVEGVENIQLLYGEDTGSDNVVDRYRTAAAVTDWNKVINVKISLLMSTEAEVASAPDENQYDLNGSLINPTDDKRLRRVFSTTVTLRNRV